MATIPYVFASATSPLPLSQLDDNFTSLNAAKAELTASTTPLMDGAAAIGSATTAAKADHVHPTDTSLTVFTPSGTGAVPTTVQAKLRESVSVMDFGCSTSGDISASLILAIASGASKINLPAGNFTLATPIVITRSITIDGAGSSNDVDGVGVAGVSSTKINYSGTGTAFTLSGILSGNAIENIHLSNFIIVGTSLGTGGIALGVPASGGFTGMVAHCSLKNIVATGFTQNSIGYGIRLAHCLETLLENVQGVGNTFGICSLTSDVFTTINLLNCFTGANTYGVYWNGATNQKLVSYGLVCESNKNEGLTIVGNLTAVKNHSYYDCWFENNNLLGGQAQASITGSLNNVASGIDFYGPYFDGTFRGIMTSELKFDWASSCQVFYPKITVSERIEVTANTSYCNLYSNFVTYTGPSVTGNTTANGVPMRIYTRQNPSFPSGTATPSVNGQCPVYRTLNIAPTTITNLLDGFEGQMVTLVCNDANTIILANATLHLSGPFYSALYINSSGNYPAITLQNTLGVWQEVSRTSLTNVVMGVTSAATGIATTLFTLPANVSSSGGYLLNMYGTAGAAFSNSATIVANGSGVPTLLRTDGGGSSTITVSGQNVKVTQASGASVAFVWSYLKVNNQ